MQTRSPAAGPVLFEVPDAAAARFVAGLWRLAPQPIGVRLSPTPGRTWVLVARPPAHLLDRAADPSSGISIRPGPAAPPREPEFRLVGPLLTAVDGGRPTAISVPLRLRPAAAGEESFWVLPGGVEEFARLVRDADQDTLAPYHAAFVRDGAGRTAVLLRGGKRHARRPLPLSADGFAPHPHLPMLFLPADRTLAPHARRDALADAVAPPPGAVGWLTADGPAVRVDHAPESTFRPVQARVEYTVPPRVSLTPEAHETAFAFAPLAVVPEATTTAVAYRPPAGAPTGRPRDGWLSRSLDRIARRLRPARVTPPGVRPPTPPPRPAPAVRSTLDREAAGRRVLAELPGATPDRRAAIWAELAGTAAAAGHHADAGTAWLNAVWELPDPPAAWLDRWLEAELKAARIDSVPGTAGAPPRVLAVYLVWAGHRPDAAYRDHLPGYLDALARHRARVPVRAGWLARLAAARAGGGDPLGLARWRDDVFRHLADAGLTLDLDAPSFLRGETGPARDWLLRVREPALRWVAGHATGGRLQWAGLDADTDATAAYADLLFAWGLSRVGAAAASREREAAAAGVLARAGADVHAVLLAAFRHRVREARRARPERAGLPRPARAGYDRLPPLGRYAVDKLRAHCGVLEPGERVNPYRGRNRPGYLGTDALARRLSALPDLGPDALADEVRAVLAADPGPAGRSRLAVGLAPVLTMLPPDLAAEAVGLIPTALLGLGEWAYETRSDGTDLSAPLADLLLAAADAAAVLDAPDVLVAAVRFLLGPAAPPPAVTGPALAAVGVRFFRGLRRCGLTAEARELLRRFAGLSADVGFAAGWYAAGDDDTALALLDAARERLLAADARPDPRAAVGYAAALGHAPPSLALGRLEELFHRLGPLPTRGSTNRYFTLRPLELIDAAVRAAVGDDLALGPAVRRWLDDDEWAVRRRVSRDLDRALAAPADLPDAAGTA